MLNYSTMKFMQNVDILHYMYIKLSFIHVVILNSYIIKDKSIYHF